MFNTLKTLFTGYGHAKVIQPGVFLSVLMVVTPTSVVFSLINGIYGHVFLACFLAVLSVVMMLLLYFGRKGKWLPYFEYVLMFFSCLAFTFIFMEGGIAQTGIYWTLIFPFFAFILMGVKKGWFWIACFIFIQLDVVFLFAINMVSLPYSQGILLIVLAMFLFFTLIASVFELQNEKNLDALIQLNMALNAKEEALLDAYACLEQQVFHRTSELQESNTQLILEIKQKEQAIISMRHTELKFQHAQRLESLGTLVGGIAHDFNNILSGINANLYLAKRQIQPEKGAGRLDQINVLTNRAADMIKQMLTFARKDAVEMENLDLRIFMDEAFNLSTISIPESIVCRYECSSEDMFIHGNATQIQQVLMNLMNNARDALWDVDRPEITVSLSTMMPDQSFCEHQQDAELRPYALLRVQDNGMGIPEGLLETIFDPFFTTKEEGKGTGLGLAMIYGAVQSHDGLIAVHSKVGYGSCFDLYFPLLENEQNMQTKAQEGEIIQGNGETILLVDDDMDICESHSQLLRNIGYQVHVACDGLQACEMYEQHDIDLVIMDIVMPLLGGVAASERMRAADEKVRIIFVSGYDKDNDMTSELVNDWRHVLNKPLDIKALSVAIYKELQVT